MAILSIEHVSKRFGSFTALDDVSLQVEQGEAVAIIGSSGSGKSTLLRCVNNLERVSAGRIVIDGDVLVDTVKGTAKYPPEKEVRRICTKTGMVFQHFNLFPHLTCLENITVAPLRILKRDKAAVLAEAMELLDVVGLRNKADNYPAQLSGGQKQRIAIARAVINEPKVLLLDEPLGALDLKLRRQMQLELKRLQKRLGITFIYITHDQEEAINMSDRIGVMHEGVLEQLGTPNEVYYQPKTSYVADFVGNANILRLGGETFAIRSENILMNGETVCTREAVVVEKSFAGGQLRILFRLPDGQTLTASRYGIDNDLQPGQQVKIGWDAKDAVKVIDNDKDENHK